MSWLIKTIVTVSVVLFFISDSHEAEDFNSSSSLVSSSTVPTATTEYLEYSNDSLTTIETEENDNLINFNNTRIPEFSSTTIETIIESNVDEKNKINETPETIKEGKDSEYLLCPHLRLDDSVEGNSGLPVNNQTGDQVKNGTETENGSNSGEIVDHEENENETDNLPDQPVIDRPSEEESEDKPDNLPVDGNDDRPNEEDVNGGDEEQEEEEADSPTQLLSFGTTDVAETIPHVGQPPDKEEGTVTDGEASNGDDSFNSCFTFGNNNVMIKILINGGQECDDQQPMIINTDNRIKPPNRRPNGLVAIGNNQGHTLLDHFNDTATIDGSNEENLVNTTDYGNYDYDTMTQDYEENTGTNDYDYSLALAPKN